MGDRKMEYAIKQKTVFGSTYYVRLENNTGPGFSYKNDLDKATRFDSLNSAVTAIIARTKFMQNVFVFPCEEESSFTIVGTKEVNTPRYEEVAL